MSNEKLQFINGARRDGNDSSTITVTDPSTGAVITTGAAASTYDAENAVSAARRAFDEWSRRPPVERSEIMLRWAEKLRERESEIAAIESRNGGKALRLAAGFDIPGVIDNVAFFAGAARQLEGKATAEYSGDHTSSLRREPVGVVGSIIAWNYPLQLAAWKVLPAVAAGNTIVLKPSEFTPLSALIFAETATAAGLPEGVFNVITGPGGVVGKALVNHPDVDIVSFTGSTGVGKQIGAEATRGLKRVHLELGGKAPFLVFDDADVEAAARGAVAGSLINAGQDCTAATRAYVQRGLYEQFVARVAELMKEVRLGAADDPATHLGSLISQEHRDNVAEMVERARQSGAKVVTGGRIPSDMPEAGAYYEPTLITDCAQNAEIVQEEIFGPVLVCLPFDHDDEGVALSNDTPYGLAASVWSQNVYRTQRASREIQAGCVWVNDHIPIFSEMPHGGYKASGFGNDMSQYSLDEYTNIKHVASEVTQEQHKEWHDLVFTTPDR